MPRPKVQNSVYPFMPGGKTEDTKYVQRYIRDPAEIEDIKKSGYVNPKPGGKAQKYWTAVNEPNVRYSEGQSLIRVPRGSVSEDRAVRADDVEMHDRKTGKWAPIRGGGTGGMSGAGSSVDRREMQLGAELDPKSMLKREDYKNGGTVSSASKRGDGIAQRGKTKGRLR